MALSMSSSHALSLPLLKETSLLSPKRTGNGQSNHG